MWRELHIVRYIRKGAALADFVTGNLAAIQVKYRKAYIEMLNKVKAADNYLWTDHRFKDGSTPDYNKICKDTLEASGNALFTQHMALDSAANHAADAAMFLMVPYSTFVLNVHMNLHGAVMAGDIAVVAATAGMTLANFASGLGTMPPGGWPATAQYNRVKATRTWLINNTADTEGNYSDLLTNVMMNLVDKAVDQLMVLSGHKTGGSDEAPDGITVIHFNHFHSVVPQATANGFGVSTLNGMAYDSPDHKRERCAFALWENLVASFVHEIGHHLFLPHSPFPAASPPGGSAQSRHDVVDNNCIMSYDPSRTEFCGLCQLRLRGWSATALDMTGAKNKKP
jgi:hypothetical protein